MALTVDASATGVSQVLPGSGLCDEATIVVDATIKALAAQNADFDFDHVEPAGVFGRVVEFQPSKEASRL